MQRRTLSCLVLLGILASCVLPGFAENKSATTAQELTSKATKSTELQKKEVEKKETLKKVVKTDKEWRKQLSRMQYEVTRKHATERARTGKYWNYKAKGTYRCICCDLPLFSSKTKFKSGTGWPSFYAPLKKEFVGQSIDRGFFMTRTEVHCNRCDAHLGHVFSDGPRPTGLRYCINSASLKFESEAAAKRKAAAEAKAKAKEAASDDSDARR